MNHIGVTQKISAQLEKLAKERNILIDKIREYEQLLKQKNQSIQYTDKISVPFYQFSLDLKTVKYINPASEKLFGHSREEIYKDATLWFSAIHEEDKNIVIQALDQMAKDKKREVLIEYRIKKSNTDIVYIADRAALIYDENDNPICIMGFLTDITGYIDTRREMLLYDQILSVAQTEKSIDIAIEAILKISCLSFDWDEGEAWLIDQSKDSLYCIKIWHRLHDEIKEFYEKSYELKIPTNQGFQADVIRSKLPTLVNDYGQNKQFIRGDLATKSGLKTAFGLPISYHGNTLGVLMYFSKSVKKLNHEQIRTMQRISDVLGEVIQDKISKEQMSYIIYHDKLTGLKNRLGLESFLQNEFNINKYEPMTLVIIDIDRFSKINELMGFSFGDNVIRNITTKLNEYLSETASIIANIGGDQFALVFSNMQKPQQIAPILEKIKSIINTPFIVDDHRILLTASIGVASYPYDAIDHISLLKNSIIALNHAKSRGGDCMQYFSETLQKSVTDAIRLESDLRKAITENDLRLYYQPKVDIKSGCIIGVEALLRWQHPNQGLILPGSFLSVAEQSDLIVYIGKWVLLEICKNYPFAQLNIPVSVNFSARQFLIQYDIESFIKVLLEKLSLQPNMLEIEVTESQIMSDPTRCRQVLSMLQNIGISIAIDDFGTGYSSFEYLKQFRPNRIKIDKSFIDGLPDDRENASIVKAIIALCKSLNIRSIAEGVENSDQLRFLIKEECDEIQGFYFSKPVPIYDVRNMIDTKVKLVLPDHAM